RRHANPVAVELAGPERKSVINMRDLKEILALPSLRKAIPDLRDLVPRKAQVHEPLTVHTAGSLFQQGNATLVCGDEIVVDEKDFGDAVLGLKIGHAYQNLVKRITIDAG